MSATALSRFHAALEAHNCHRQGALSWTCPAHDDQRASLSVKEGRDRRVIFHCHAGCHPEDVLVALGLEWAVLFPRRSKNAHPAGVATYDYVDEHGTLLYQAVRLFPKDFRRRRPDGLGGWIWRLDDTRLVLFRLPQVIKAVETGQAVFVVEGEKDAIAVERAGGIATTVLGGVSGKWLPEFSELLARVPTVVVAHHDESGYQRARKVASWIRDAGGQVQMVRPVPDHKGADAADHLGARYGLDGFLAVDDEPSTPALVAPSALIAQPTELSWPELAPAALHGIAGQVVATLAPHTEANPAGLLLTFLATAGNVIGPSPHAIADAAPHPARLFPVLVGQTSRARKGSAWAQIRRLFERVSPPWAAGCILPGLASGEALIAEVRDGDDGDDLGVADKRRLVLEPEFARLLAVAGREGATLSAVIREAWDGNRLKNRTKHDPLVATGAHISVVGHITREELLRRLSDTEAANGFANRFLFTLVRRSRLLPEGGNLDPAVLDHLADQVQVAIARAGHIGILTRSPEAREVWAKAYQRFGEDVDGLAGAVTARGEAQALRLSVAYAVLDGSSTIEPIHIEAALAVWSYCEQSALHVFGNALGDPIADRLLDALVEAGPAGLDGTAQSAVFGRHVSADRLAQARKELGRRNRIVTLTEATGGRPRLISKVRTATVDAQEAR